MVGPSNHEMLLNAQAFLEMGQVEHAVDLLCELLGRDPNDAVGHALLAIALVNQGRIHAARHEAGIALSLAPGEAFAHYAAAMVAMLQTRFREAHDHLDEALALEPDSADFLAGRGRLYLLEERWRDAGEAFQAALSIEAEHVESLAGLAEAYWRAGYLGEAEATTREALRIAPANGSALVQMGWLHLERGEIEQAREHALWVLARDANDQAALTLIVAVKASESWFLSLWWRFNSWMMHKGDAARIGILVGAYLLVQVANTVLAQSGMTGASGMLQFVWLGFCIYTWVGPAIFDKQLQKELEKVRLQPDF